MGRLLQRLVWLGAVIGNLSMSAILPAQDKEKATLEIRQAETEPAPGLVEAVVEGSKQKLYLHRESVLTKADIAGALAKRADDQAMVEIRLTEKGQKKFARATERHVNKPLAILVNGKVVSAPIVRDKITGENLQLTGNFTPEQAEQIARALRGK
jgi:preprotein translocase subunit SecD